ncbi:hypothetical protein Emag_003242 [Eimeria magna]
MHSRSEVRHRSEGPQTPSDQRRRCKQVALFIALLGVTFWAELFGERSRSRLLVRIPSVVKTTLSVVHHASSATPVEPEPLTEQALEPEEPALPLADLGDSFVQSSADATEAQGQNGGRVAWVSTIMSWVQLPPLAPEVVCSSAKPSIELELKPTTKLRLDWWADRGQDLSPLLHESVSPSTSELTTDGSSTKALSLESASLLIALAYALVAARLHAKLHKEGKANAQLARPSTATTSPGGSRTPTQVLSSLKPLEEACFHTTDDHSPSPQVDVVDGPLWSFPAASEVEFAVIPAALQGAGLPAVGGLLEQLIAASSVDFGLPVDEAEMDLRIDGPPTQRRAPSKRRTRKRAYMRSKSAQVALLLALLGVRLFTDFVSGKRHPLLKHIPAFFRKTLANLPDPLANVIQFATGIRPPKGDVRAARAKRTSPSPSFTRHKLRKHKQSSQRHQMLPSVDEAEARLSLSAKKGKKFLAQNVSLVADAPSRLSALEKEVIAAVTRVLIGNSEEDLMGQVIKLKNVSPLQDTRTETPSSRSLKIRKFLGKGSSWTVFQVEDVDTGEELALRIFLMQKLQLSIARTIELGKQALDLEERSARQACGLTDPLLVAGEKGIAVPFQTAELSGIPEVSSTAWFHVFSRVQLMELMEEDLGSLLERHKRVPIEAKEYIAHRLLLQVLHLQQAQVSHTDLKLENCLLRKDGSFLLGDFGYSTPWGECMHSLSRLTLAYAEPELLIDFRAFLREDAQVTPHPTSDLWSLGAVLFELFTDGDLPYGIMEAHNDMNGMYDLAKKLLDREASSEELEPALEEAEVPSRWRELILKLLEPQRTNRITGSEIMEEFPDLYGSLLS